MRPAGGPRAEAALAAAAGELFARTGVARGSVRAVLSPYRVCPLGAHTDHQHGPVLGAAIDLFTALAFTPAAEPVIEIGSAHHAETWSADLLAASIEPPAAGASWTRYARGAAAVLRDRLPARATGLRAYAVGALPGGGLSSSASVVIAYLMALAHVNGIVLPEAVLVALARRVENEHVGVACGILDPASIVGSRRGHLLAIDTAAGRWEPVALGPSDTGVCFLVAYTGLSRHLAGTDFNRRVDECREAARRLGGLAGLAGISLLGELPDEVFDAHLAELPDPFARRARHFASERARVRRGLACWRGGDLASFGALMSASCESSIRDYQTGSPELVRLQEILLATPGVLGARFSGAGFGGCAIALVEPAAAAEAAGEVARRFGEAFPPLAARARAFVAHGEDGARIV